MRQGHRLPGRKGLNKQYREDGAKMELVGRLRANTGKFKGNGDRLETSKPAGK